MNSKNTLYNPC